MHAVLSMFPVVIAQKCRTQQEESDGQDSAQTVARWEAIAFSPRRMA
jgi:hypothetical protein